jgi:hypothetical protein
MNVGATLAVARVPTSASDLPRQQFKNRRRASYHALNEKIPACAAQAGILLLYGFPAMRRVFF